MTAFEINSPDIMVEDFGEDMVLLNLQSGFYYSVSGRATAFLVALQDGIIPGKMCDKIKMADEQAGADACTFLETLKSHHLIREASGTEPKEPDENRVKTILSAGTDFGFEHFDDLQDLLLADPIHDVDSEAGWPTRA